MDYSYLNQAGFENCSLAGMDPTLQNCQLPGSYGDLSACGQVSQAYRYNPVRSFSGGPGITSASCSMMPRPRDPTQPPMFHSGMTHSSSANTSIYSYISLVLVTELNCFYVSRKTFIMLK